LKEQNSFFDDFDKSLVFHFYHCRMKIRHLIMILALGAKVCPLTAQSGYQFTVVKDNLHGKVEDQCQTGTCWSFATVSFLEAEVMRTRKGEKVDLSEMANARYVYPQKAASYVRYQGKQQFGPGALGHDVINTMRDFGLVPESAYSGFVNGETEYNHNVLDTYLEKLTQTVVEKKLNEQGNDWMAGIESLLDTYIGPLPKEFVYNGKTYTPAAFRDYLGLKANDYVMLTSFTHHPYYSSFAVEVPDNWSKGYYYNLPLDEFQQVADHALNNGYTIAWDADVSEPGFSYKNNMAILPAEPLKKEEAFTKKHTEQAVTAEIRQAGYDRFETTDDHLMHITGLAKDQDGALYYITKNSWGEKNSAKGYQYVSSPYFRAKTICMIVHKDALPKEIAKKMNG
jgi:bleomycin hydrolase